MDIKELRTKYLAAKASSEAKSDDADLKSAMEAAKSAYEAALDAEDDEDEEDPTPGEKGDDKDKEDSLDESTLDPKTKAFVQKLRRENAKHRTTAKNLGTRLSVFESGLKKLVGGEGDERSTEDKLAELTQENESRAFKTAVLEAAMDHGVSKEEREFFEFKVGKRLVSLKEGEELTDEDFADIAKEVKKSSGGGNKVRTSVDDDKAGNPNGKGEMTVDQFVQLGVIAKSALYDKNRALYDKLFAEAKTKRRL